MARTDGVAPGLSILVPLATPILLVVTLRYARDVLIPICLAVLLTFILSPLVSWLETVRLGRIPAVVIVSVFFTGATLALAWTVGWQIIGLGAQLPDYRDNIEAKLESLRSIREGKLKDLSDSITYVQNELKRYHGINSPSPAQSETNSPPKRPRTTTIVETQARPTPLITTILGPVLQPIAEGVVVLALVVFMLANRESLRNKIFRLPGRGHLTMTTHALDDAAERVSRYLVWQSIVNTSFGFLIGLGLYFIGMPNPILWGVLSGLLRYIPYIGPITVLRYQRWLHSASSPAGTVPCSPRLCSLFTCTDKGPWGKP
jgi:predicted PurR-regulated permease PerM